MLAPSVRTLASVLLLACSAVAQLGFGELPQLEPSPAKEPVLICATSDDFSTGAVAALADGAAPALELVAATDGGKHVRRFGQQIFVVNRLGGSVVRVPLAGGAPQLYSLARDSKPMDVLVAGAPSKVGVAWVSRRDEPRLLRLDLETGVATESIDLSPVGEGDAIALGFMERHGSTLFVQVRVFDAEDAPGGDSGVLAVVDLERELLVDVDPVAPGVQGIALLGAPPRFKMQIVDDTLFVSSTETFNDIRGGVEKVNLSSLASEGYVISEASGHSDMGGFVMLDAQHGYYVFHTDLLASTHLVAFSVDKGPEPGSLIDLLGDTLDVLVYDPASERLYLPSGFASNGPGLYVFDTGTNSLLGPPVSTGFRPHDVLLVAPLALFEPAP